MDAIAQYFLARELAQSIGTSRTPEREYQTPRL
jgi:hypothetical protein